MQVTIIIALFTVGFAEAQLSSAFAYPPAEGSDKPTGNDVQPGFTYEETTGTSFGPTEWGRVTCENTDTCVS